MSRCVRSITVLFCTALIFLKRPNLFVLYTIRLSGLGLQAALHAAADIVNLSHHIGTTIPTSSDRQVLAHACPGVHAQNSVVQVYTSSCPIWAKARRTHRGVIPAGVTLKSPFNATSRVVGGMVQLRHTFCH